MVDAFYCAGPLQKRPVVVGSLEQVGAGDHHPIHPLRPHHPRHVVRHETPVAGSHQRNLGAPRWGDAQSVEEADNGGGLKRLRPARGASGGATEEQKVRHDEVVVGGQGSDLAAPLPRAAWAEAVDEDERGLFRYGSGGGGGRGEEGGGDPAMYGGFGVDGYGMAAEAGRGVDEVDEQIDQPHQTEFHPGKFEVVLQKWRGFPEKQKGTKLDPEKSSARCDPAAGSG